MKLFLGTILILLIHSGEPFPERGLNLLEREAHQNDPVTIEVNDDAEINLENFEEANVEADDTLEKFDPDVEDSILDNEIPEAQLDLVEEDPLLTEFDGSLEDFETDDFEEEDEEEEEEEALPELSDDEKSQVLELINSGELNPNDIDENDLPDPDRTRVTPGLVQATRPLQNAFNFDGIRDSGQSLFDAQANFFNTFTRPFFDAGNRFLEPFQDVGSQFGAGQLSFGEAGQNLFSQQGELASQAFQPFAETGNNLFELGGLEFDFRNPFGIRRQSQAKKLKAKKIKKKAVKLALLAKLKKKKLAKKALIAILLKKKKAKKVALLAKLKLKFKKFVAKKKAKKVALFAKLKALPGLVVKKKKAKKVALLAKLKKKKALG
jgi:hypothetical protein